MTSVSFPRFRGPCDVMLFPSGKSEIRYSKARPPAFSMMFGDLPIEVECDPNKAWVLSLARMHRLSVYDAVRLELAQMRILLFAALDSSRASRRERCQPWHRAVREVIVAAKETGASCGNNVSLSSAAKATCAIAAPPIGPA